MGFFDRFRKQEAASLEELQAKGYWVDLVRAYFAKGKECLARGDRERADLWLSRAQAICDSDDGIYEKVGGKLIDQCSDLLGELEDDLFGTQVVERVEAEYSTLSGARKRLWGLLTLCRLERLLTAVGDFPGCAPLKDTGEAIDALLDHYYGEAGEVAWARLEEYNDFIAGWCDSPAILDERAALPAPAGAFREGGPAGRAGAAPAGAFRLPDLGGEIVPTELSLYLDVVVSGDLSREEIRGLDDPQVLDRLDLNDQSGMVRCGCPPGPGRGGTDLGRPGLPAHRPRRKGPPGPGGRVPQAGYPRLKSPLCTKREAPEGFPFLLLLSGDRGCWSRTGGHR